MTESQLKSEMNKLVKELHNPIVSNTASNERVVIAKAVQLGMHYQEEMIKEGINIVFQQLHKNIKTQ